MTGLFVAFEGGEGVGKSTQISLAAAWARAAGNAVVETREPGGTPLGVELRALVLDPAGQVDPRAEALLYAADRAQHVASVIRPALAGGALVLTDRYVDSTLAYQGAGRGLGDEAQVVTRWATGGLLPDLTVVLDLDPAIGLSRAGRRASLDRLESAAMSFHEAVRAAFLQLAEASPERYLVLDATRPVEQVHEQVRAAIAHRLG